LVEGTAVPIGPLQDFVEDSLASTERVRVQQCQKDHGSQHLIAVQVSETPDWLAGLTRVGGSKKRASRRFDFSCFVL
jgi:hypothetical protein